MGDLKLTIKRGLLSGLLVCGSSAFAQNSLLNQEAAARAEASREAHVLLEAGDDAYLEDDFKTAVSKYGEALVKLPAGAKAVAQLRNSAVQRYTQAALVRAQSLSRAGDYAGAERLLATVDKVNPDDAKVANFRKKLESPIRTNPSLTKEHTAKVDKVRRRLYEAEGFYDLGQFDRAEMTYEDVLRIDKHNKAARRGIERVNAARSDYSAAARDQARSKLLADVGAAWEQQDHLETVVPLVGSDLNPQTLAEGLEDKLSTFVIPEVSLNKATLDEAIDFLQTMARELDVETLDEAAKGISFITQLGDEDHPAVQKVRASRVSLKLRNVPLSVVLRQITLATGTEYRVDEFAVVITAAGFSDPSLIRRDFRVPPGFLTGNASAQADAAVDVFADNGPKEGGLAAKRLTAEEKLKSFEVPFPEGATASYNNRTNILTVRNTAENIRLIGAIVDDASLTEPVTVAVRTTVIEVTQSNLEELGFDVVSNGFNVGSNYKLSGGTVSGAGNIDDTISGSPLTAGLRAGDLSTPTNSLDSLLDRESPPTASGSITTNSAGSFSSSLNVPTNPVGDGLRASGIISLRGVIDNAAHEILMRGLSQKKGVDIMVRPEVMTQPGQAASVQSVMEFPYPEEYEPPELPNAVGGNQGIVTPATPTSFTIKETGVSLEVLPEVGPDRRIIEVQVNPVITDFEGFVNYGTPIVGSSNSVSFNLVAGTATTNSVLGELTANQILKPLFRTIKGKTALRILDGQTIVMGGLRQEVRRHVSDKVPILGDLPIAGRFFRHNGISVEQRSVIILVNVELLDPSGKPYRNR